MFDIDDVTVPMNVDAIARSPTVLLAFSVDVGHLGDPDRLSDDGDEGLTQFQRVHRQGYRGTTTRVGCVITMGSLRKACAAYISKSIFFNAEEENITCDVSRKPGTALSLFQWPTRVRTESRWR